MYISEYTVNAYIHKLLHDGTIHTTYHNTRGTDGSFNLNEFILFKFRILSLFLAGFVIPIPRIAATSFDAMYKWNSKRLQSDGSMDGIETVWVLSNAFGPNNERMLWPTLIFLF